MVGHGYRLARAGAYAGKGNKKEVERSVKMDLMEEINPFKKLANATKGIISLT